MPVTPRGMAIRSINHDWHSGMEPWTGGSKGFSTGKAGEEESFTNLDLNIPPLFRN